MKVIEFEIFLIIFLNLEIFYYLSKLKRIQLIEKIDNNENAYFCKVSKSLPAFINGQKISRDDCIKIFKAIIANNDQSIDAYELYIKTGVFEYSFATFLCDLKVFEELKIFNIIEKPFLLIYNKGIKVNLSDSKLYNMIASE